MQRLPTAGRNMLLGEIQRQAARAHNCGSQQTGTQGLRSRDRRGGGAEISGHLPRTVSQMSREGLQARAGQLALL